MRYTKRFAGLALALGTMLMGVGTMSAADRKDAYQDRAPLTEAVRDGRQAVPARTFAIAAKRDSRNQRAQGALRLAQTPPRPGPPI